MSKKIAEVGNNNLKQFRVKLISTIPLTEMKDFSYFRLDCHYQLIAVLLTFNEGITNP